MDLRELIKETLEDHLNKSLIIKESVELSEALKYHVDNELTLTNNIFRAYSESYFDLVNEVRRLWEAGKIKLNEEDTLMVESDLGKKVMIKGQLIYLDAPFVNEDEVLEEAVDETLEESSEIMLEDIVDDTQAGSEEDIEEEADNEI